LAPPNSKISAAGMERNATPMMANTKITNIRVPAIIG
jgi:hypothetical protein